MLFLRPRAMLFSYPFIGQRIAQGKVHLPIINVQTRRVHLGRGRIVNKPFLFRYQSTNTSAGTGASSGASGGSKFSRYAVWNNTKFRIFFRIVRNFVLIGSVGSAAFALGQIEYIEDPHGFEKKTMGSLFLQAQNRYMLPVGEDSNLSKEAYVKAGSRAYAYDLKEGQHIQIEEDNPIWVTALRSKNVFKRVKSAALNVVEANILELESSLKENEGNPVLRVMIEDELHNWYLKKEHLSVPWKIIVTDSEQPNAFVNGLLPRRVFVTQGLLEEFCKTDEQLSLVLSHELSHFLLGHTKDILMVNAVAQVVAVALISVIDPTGGLSSFLLELAIPWMGSLLGMQFSRDQEHEADDLGFRISSSACYDPREALKLFHNMKMYSDKLKEVGQGVAIPMLSSHPMDEDRFKTQLENLENNHIQYKNNGCDETLIDRFYKIWSKEEK